MCDITTALMIGSTVATMAGQMYSASAEANQMEYQAKVDQQNAVLADRRAKDAIERGQLEEQRKKQEGTAVRKQQEGSFAAANIDTGYGSAIDIITSSAIAAEQDAAIIRSNAEREAEDYDQQAWNYRTSSQANTTNAKGRRIGGIFQAAGTALDGGSSVFKYRASIA